jgi:integral membrane protein (TIGR01906 family)
LKKIPLIVLIIFLSLFCLLISLEKNSFKELTYSNAYNEYNIENITGKTHSELMGITNDLLVYLKGNGGDEILELNFNEREILHMRDVQVLFKYGFILKYISIIVSILIIGFFLIQGEKDILGIYMYKGLFINWIIAVLLIVMIYLDFNKYFTYFHEIFFTNDLWLLDPNTDLLIQMLPEEFFITMAKNIGLSFFIYVAILQVIGYVIYKRGRRKDEKRIKLF